MNINEVCESVIDFNKIVELVNQAAAKYFKDGCMNPIHECVIRGTLEGLTYREIHQRYNKKIKVSLDTFIKDYGCELWKSLKNVKTLEKIHKKNAETLLTNLIKAKGGDTQLTNLINAKGGDTHPSCYEHTLLPTIYWTLDNQQNLTKKNILRKLNVIGDAESFKIFGLLSAPTNRKENWTAQDLFDRLPHSNNGLCLEEFIDSVLHLIRGGRSNNSRKNYREDQLTFWSSDSRLLKLTVSKMEVFKNGSIRFTMILQEIIAIGFIENAPNLKSATLATAIILGNRLQWDVCDIFLLILNSGDFQNKPPKEKKRLLLKLQNSYQYIKEDAESRRKGEAYDQTNEDRLRDCFESEHEKALITNNLQEQESHKQVLLEIDRYSIDEIRFALTELSKLNKIVMRMILRELNLYYLSSD
ncbi:hypothetical protein [Halotia branconii]|uniref:vWA-MoxR associated protein N-terminal HTH domain-containing protein n=1 Tax=Halotia branconii CENA392 TaxID=1539056 RepID=A0AAJ6P7G5_9CYAN|nr:hypothetical protein [Halotia branconii]WGV23562.1 hypothetical protein QI031_17255 [Halotia branconii CENA392]